MAIDRRDNPDFLNDYITHISVVKGLAKSTVGQYYQDIRRSEEPLRYALSQSRQ